MLSREARQRKINSARRRSHHLWSAKNDDGVVRIYRKKPEEEIKMAIKSRTAKEINKDMISESDISAVYWGLFGASLIDDKTLSSSIPRSIANRFSVTASTNDDSVPTVYEWDKLRAVFTAERINQIRKDISCGMQIRIASKFFNIPFLAAADIIYSMEGEDHSKIKNILGMIRVGNRKKAINKYGVLALKLAKIYKRYKNPANSKIAVDDSAKEYWKSYNGPFGAEMVREIKKRVRADLAFAWMKKHGVDQAAAEYWSKYYGSYGEEWVNVVPKKISPSNN